MSDKRKNLIRQFSLQSEAPPSRPILKKQLSSEFLDSVPNFKDKKDRPRLIKIAWGENQERKKIPDTVEIKKCIEYRRPTTAKLRTQKSIDRDSVLFTRQELAERLRKAWIEREEKQNIDIFLQHQCESDEEIKENKNEITSTNEFNYVPSNTSTKTRDGSINLSVMIPQLPNEQNTVEVTDEITEEKKVPKLIKQTSINKENECKPEKIKPSSATTRREMFQKRTNTAFNGSFNLEKKPTLVRQMSVPTKDPKPFAVKRRLKVNRKKEREEFSDEDISDKIKKKERCKSAPGGEIVTMVSLVSPAGSDVEEVVEKKPEPKVKEKSILHQEGSNEPVKTITLRNTVKKVSFQQSTIHAIRSFSASFPSRRGSMASVTKSQINQEREKRTTGDTTLNETRVAKRRHITDNRNKNSFEETTETKPESVPKVSEDEKEIKQDSIKIDLTTNDEEEQDPETPKFVSAKERECWSMFKKMSDKGLPVSYDTILRGMLTPTEYRMSRKEIVTTTP